MLNLFTKPKQPRWPAPARRPHRHRHRLDQRHRPRHRQGAGAEPAPPSCSTASAIRPRSRRSAPSLAEDNDVDVAYDSADMSKPDAIRMMVGARRSAASARSISSSTMPASSMSRRSANFPPEKWDAILAINLSAAFHLVQATFDGMSERGFGRIVNIASAHGLIASPFKSAYVAAKHGIVGLTKVVALEGAEFGVTGNAICPGYVWTPLVEKQIDDQAKSHNIARDAVIRDVLLKNQPTKRFATVEEMGALTVFLCSDGAASITGTALPVDGGWTAH